MNILDVKINQGWKELLHKEFFAPYFQELKQFISEEKSKYTIYPPGAKIFSAFDFTPPENLKVVIIGQDPYHGRGQANGLCFSVSPGINQPPSLVNIFKELKDDLGIPLPKTGNLEPWAKQGILLLNATLTVREGLPGSHQNKGWEQFTDAVIKTISDKKSGIVFLLWGKYAQSKETLIDSSKHHILKAAHPSPLARGAFFGCKHFSKTNQLLNLQGLAPIDWRIETIEQKLF
jgi:uracil-DNA glycosylase